MSCGRPARDYLQVLRAGCGARAARFATAALAVLGLGACATVAPVEPPPETAAEAARYARLFPYYVENCAVSQLGKKPGFGADLYSGIGGHAVLYLNGVCRRRDAAYPVMQMCDEQPADSAADGVGVSVNAHYSNATWVAVEGRDFVFKGGLPSDAALTRSSYAAVQAAAMRKGIYDGVAFQERVFKGMPPGFTRDSFKYEVSVATDYAVAFGRNRYCARLPVSRTQMLRIVDYFNAVNQPYREGRKTFHWNVLSHSCSHINHNALAVADVWSPWPMDRFILISAFDFPVPKNEIVNLMQRANDLPIEDPAALYRDPAARAMLLEDGRLPTQPGALMERDVILHPNQIYATRSRIIFYDDPLTQAYRRAYTAILSQPRYFRLRDNLAYFLERYRRIAAQREPLPGYLARHPEIGADARGEFGEFYQRYYEYIDHQIDDTARNLARLD